MRGPLTNASFHHPITLRGRVRAPPQHARQRVPQRRVPQPRIPHRGRHRGATLSSAAAAARRFSVGAALLQHPARLQRPLQVVRGENLEERFLKLKTAEGIRERNSLQRRHLSLSVWRDFERRLFRELASHSRMAAVGERRSRSPERVYITSPAEVLHCTVCLDVLSAPVSLPACGHTYCRACVATILAKPAAQRKCPTCRRDVSRGVVAAVLPLNWVVKATVDALRVRCRFGLKEEGGGWVADEAELPR